MHRMLRIALIVALGALCVAVPGIQAANDTATPPPRATLVSPHRTATTYHVRDMGGRMVTVHVPALASPDVKVSDSAQGTVNATVQSVDSTTNQVRVQTQEGQMLVLHLAPESLANMQIGAPLTLQVAQRSAQ
jgi:hypothetical protein